MKHKLLIGILAAGFAFSGSSNAQTDPDFLYINGVPILKSNLWQCQPYSRTRIQMQASISLYSPSYKEKSWSQTVESYYTPPNYYVIEAAYRIQRSANRSYSASHSTFAEGQSFVTFQELQNINKRVNDYIGNLNIEGQLKADITVKINELTEGYYRFSSSVSSSHNTAKHTATVWGNGRLVGVRSWYEGYLDIDVLCIPPELKDPATIERFMKLYVDKKANVQSGTWTTWEDRDDASGNGDFEVKTASQFANCNALDIEARVVGLPTIYKTGNATPDVLQTFTKTDGLICAWNQQTDGQCNDYEVRYYCAN